MLKLLLSKNRIVHALIKHCVEYRGEYEVVIARKMAQIAVVKYGIKHNHWKPYNDYSRDEFRVFIDTLKEQKVDFKLLRRDCQYTSDIEMVIVIERI